ncbi:RST domain [Dillenia turbinata]|uniref:RST domain n=1 Tax=Dillenia turbinata TaxID=194707 RepID=A0AAN8V792_9MAGN
MVLVTVDMSKEIEYKSLVVDSSGIRHAVLCHVILGCLRVQELLRKPTSPLMPFPALLPRLTNVLPPAKINLLAKYHSEHGVSSSFTSLGIDGTGIWPMQDTFGELGSLVTKLLSSFDFLRASFGIIDPLELCRNWSLASVVGLRIEPWKGTATFRRNFNLFLSAKSFSIVEFCNAGYIFALSAFLYILNK